MKYLVIKFNEVVEWNSRGEMVKFPFEIQYSTTLKGAKEIAKEMILMGSYDCKKIGIFKIEKRIIPELTQKARIKWEEIK